MRLAVAIDRDGQGHNRRDRRLGKLGRQPAINQAYGQMPKQIGDMRAGGPLDQSAELGANSGQRCHRREEGE
ncbi:hypothetical protein D3C83_280920 [compost metagenome]